MLLIVLGIVTQQSLGDLCSESMNIPIYYIAIISGSILVILVTFTICATGNENCILVFSAALTLIVTLGIFVALVYTGAHRKEVFCKKLNFYSLRYLKKQKNVFLSM